VCVDFYKIFVLFHFLLAILLSLSGATENSVPQVLVFSGLLFTLFKSFLSFYSSLSMVYQFLLVVCSNLPFLLIIWSSFAFCSLGELF
jgi:hypothetical protein